MEFSWVRFISFALYAPLVLQVWKMLTLLCVDALMKDDSKYNGGGSQPVTLSIRLGSAEDVSYLFSSVY